MGERSGLSDKEKASAVAEYIAKGRPKELAKRLGVAPQTIYTWARDPRFAATTTKGNGAALPVSHSLEPHPLPPAPETVAPIESVGSVLKSEIDRMEAKLTFLRSETEQIAQLLPRYKAALAALTATPMNIANEQIRVMKEA